MTKNTVIIMIIILAGVAGFVFWQNQAGGSEALAKAESAAMAAREAMNAADSPEAMMEAVQATARKDAEALIAKDAMGK
ncbi:MAG: hypothetical protein ACNYPD_02485 [Candidatus Halichondribacter symbioticus]